MRKHLIGAAILASLAFATPAHAEDSAKETLAAIDGQNQGISKLMTLIMAKTGNGIEWANTRVVSEGGKALFCMPEKLGLTASQITEMLRSYVEEHPSVADLPAGLILVSAYIETFPCPK